VVFEKDGITFPISELHKSSTFKTIREFIDKNYPEEKILIVQYHDPAKD
jgi:hypothetical protein